MSQDNNGGGTPSSCSTAGWLPPSPSVSPASFVLGNADQTSTPKLGDFSRVLAGNTRPLSQLPSQASPGTLGKVDENGFELAGRQAPNITTHQNNATEKEKEAKHVGLGDFSRIFQHWSPSGKPALLNGVSLRPQSVANLSSTASSSSPLGFQYLSGEQRIEPHPISSPPDTPPTSLEGDASVPRLHPDEMASLAAKVHQAKTAVLKAQANDTYSRRGLNENEWLCDWFEINQRGLRHPIREKLWTREQAHASMGKKMAALRALDNEVAAAFPQTTANGVHIFLDYSNINITFQHFLKSHYSIPESARFSPSPNVNLEFLHELLLRGRLPQTLFAGGSVGQKDRQEPAFVQELRKLNYVVDLRERVRVEDASFRGLNRSGGKSSSDEIYQKHNGPQLSSRFKEEFVDETLQSRIAAITLDFLDNPGTLVFVTGDGRPAPYADGFVKYAERALRRGFNLEVVSWNRGLSSAWDEVRQKQEWEGRFRVIALDPFWKDLIPVFATHT